MKIIWCILFLAVSIDAATYTVKPQGGNYSTIQACADAARPGDRCVVSSGNYAGFTMRSSGIKGSPITFVWDGASTMPAITSGSVTLNSRSHIVLDGFHFDGTKVSCSSGSRCSFIAIQNSLIEQNGTAGKTGITGIYGDDILISDCEFKGVTDDPVRGWGDRWVIRNNDVISATDVGDDHMDMWQVWCGEGYSDADELLMEGNRYIDIRGGNVHFMLQNQTPECQTFHNMIIRQNIVAKIGSQAISFANAAGGSAGFVDIAIYNNTFAEINDGSFASWQDYVAVVDVGGIDKDVYFYNNILYDAADPTGMEAINPSKWRSDNTLAYSTQRTISTDGSLAAASGAILNRDPLFTNYGSYNFTPRSNSPAIDAGRALTAVAVADSGSGTSLVVVEAAFFQPGWAGVDPDWIAVGSPSNAVRIAAINYSTNTITLANSISRRDTDPVYLYKDSDGTVVLNGQAPDIGAIEVGTQGGNSSPCDLVAPFGTVNAADYTAAISMALGQSTCVPIQAGGACDVVMVQRVANAADGGTCLSSN